MSLNPLKFSILICTKNGSEKLDKTIVSISNLELSECFDYELIIVDNNSEDNTLQHAEELCRQYLHAINWLVFSEVKSGKQNALMAAAKKASGSWLIICDDDNSLSSSYLHEAQELIKRISGVGIFGGLSYLPQEYDNLPKWFEKFKRSFAIGKFWFAPEEEGETHALWGAGMVVRREIYDFLIQNNLTILNGRKNYTLYVGGEDTELCVITKLLGYKVYFSSRLKLNHYFDLSRLSWNNFKHDFVRNNLAELYISLYELLSFEELSSNQFIPYFRKLKSKLLLNMLPNLFKKSISYLFHNGVGYSFDLEFSNQIAQLRELKYIKKDSLAYINYLNQINKLLHKKK